MADSGLLSGPEVSANSRRRLKGLEPPGVVAWLLFTGDCSCLHAESIRNHGCEVDWTIHQPAATTRITSACIRSAVAAGEIPHLVEETL